MSEFTPRVKLRRTDSYWEIALNFEIDSGEINSDKDLLDLVNLSRDWTNYCISFLRFSSKLSFFGHYVIQHEIGDDLVAFLKQNSIAHESIPKEAWGADEADTLEAYSFVLHEDEIHIVSKRLNDTNQLYRAADSIARSNLNAIISEFEFLIVRMLGIVSRSNPKKFIGMDESITVKDLLDHSNIESIIQYKVEKRISEKLRGSHSDVIDWMSSVIDIGNIDSIKKSDHYRIFLEACQRRHLFAHNGGIVNAQYVSKCEEAGISKSSLQKIGEKSAFSAQYMRKIVGRTYLLGLFILHLYLQKCGGAHRERSIGELLNISHEFLEANLTKMAKRVVDFAEYSGNQMKHETKLSFGINRALSELFDPKTFRIRSDSQSERNYIQV